MIILRIWGDWADLEGYEDIELYEDTTVALL